MICYFGKTQSLSIVINYQMLSGQIIKIKRTKYTKSQTELGSYYNFGLQH